MLLVVLIGLCATDTGCAFRRRAQARAQAKRETVYQSVLRSYSEDLKPGMTRKAVEDYLRGRNTAFRHPSSFFYLAEKVTEPTAAPDLVQIGKESPPFFFCTPMGIYIELVFVATDKRHSLRADDSDVLQQVILFRWAQCKDFQVLFDEPNKS
jgi:hypothetical protein